MSIELVKPELGGVDRESEQKTQAEKSDRYQPAGFKEVGGFLTFAKAEFQLDIDFDEDNREAAIDDMAFLAGDQWDEQVKADRLRAGRPCLTINNLPQIIGQVVGERRFNTPAIRVIPKDLGTKDVAEIRGDLIRSIESQSKAKLVYNKCLDNVISCGIANFRVNLDFTDEDVFVQDIFLKVINNPVGVVWDRMSMEETGADAGHCFIVDLMTRRAFEEKFPRSTPTSTFGEITFGQHRRDLDTVRVLEYWRMITEEREIALFGDGSVRDITELKGDDLARAESEMFAGVDGFVKRTIDRKIAQMHLITADEILQGPYNLPINRLPIIKVVGREVEVGDDRQRFGLVRFAKDPQRLKNYWRSCAAESIAMAPKAQWVAPASAVEGRQDDWREGHRTNDPLLIYNDETSTPPIRVPPPDVPVALLTEAKQNEQDMKDVTGQHDAIQGRQGNEVSGRAINARVQRGQVSTAMYLDNLNMSIMAGGDVINQLIPLVYDTVRVIRVINENDEDRIVKINDEFDPESIDITFGRYAVAIITGPSFTTKRQESADAMLTAINAFPQLMSIAGDLVVQAQDWPLSEKLAARLRKAIPPELLEGEDGEAEARQTPLERQEERQVRQMALREAASVQAEQDTIKELAFRDQELELESKTLANQKARFEIEKERALASKTEFEAAEAAMNVGANAGRVLNELNSPVPSDGQGSGTSTAGGVPRREARPL